MSTVCTTLSIYRKLVKKGMYEDIYLFLYITGLEDRSESLKVNVNDIRRLQVAITYDKAKRKRERQREILL